MQSFLKKASQKLTQDPDAEPVEHDSQAAMPAKAAKANAGAKSAASAGSKAPPQAKKGTRKKV